MGCDSARQVVLVPAPQTFALQTLLHRAPLVLCFDHRLQIGLLPRRPLVRIDFLAAHVFQTRLVNLLQLLLPRLLELQLLLPPHRDVVLVGNRVQRRVALVILEIHDVVAVGRLRKSVPLELLVTLLFVHRAGEDRVDLDVVPGEAFAFGVGRQLLRDYEVAVHHYSLPEDTVWRSALGITPLT